LPNDRITLGSTTGTTLHGSMTATLYYGAFPGQLETCAVSGGAVDEYHKTFTISTATNSTTVSTDNSSFYIGTNPSTGAAGGPHTDATHSYFWLLHYHDQTLDRPAG